MKHQSVVIGLLACMLSFAGGWFAAKGTRVNTDYGILYRDLRPCAPKVQSSAVPALARLTDQDPNLQAMRESVAYQREGSRAELWIVSEARDDDEVDAEALHYRLSWTNGHGWQVDDCNTARRLQ